MFTKCTEKLRALFRFSMVQQAICYINQLFYNETEIFISQASHKICFNRKTPKKELCVQLELKHCICTTQFAPFDSISDLIYNINLMLCVT